MPQPWDAIVVGAGPAGCAAAYDLAAAGRQVLLVDRATFPRAKACAGGLTMKAVRALRYPIDPVVRRWESRIVLEESPEQAVSVGRRAPVCAMTVREELDSFCLAKTIARGAHFQRIGTIAAVEQTEHGVCLRSEGAEPLLAHALLGCDGVHSRVRTLTTAAEWYRSGFAIEANVPYTTREQQTHGFPLTFDFAAVPRGYGWLFPRNDHVNVGLYTENVASPHERAAADPDREVAGESVGRLDRQALARYIARRCGAGRVATRPVGQFLGLGAAAYRPHAATRVLLAGDAAGFVDPLTGEGIYGAIRSGQAAAAAVDAALDAAAGARLQVKPSTGLLRSPLAHAFQDEVGGLQADLQVAEHAAARFFADPARGFRLMRLPLVPRTVLKVYAEGMSLGGLLRGVRVAARLASV